MMNASGLDFGVNKQLAFVTVGRLEIEMEICRAVEIFADGGLISSNPSREGGTWAWCWVDAYGQKINEGSGLLLPHEGMELITNNNTEVYALTKALESLPDGWSGKVLSDSQCALGWLFLGWKVDNIPMPIRIPFLAQRQRHDLSLMTGILLDGHPSKKQLAEGIGKRGNKCSKFNVWADKKCQRLAIEYKKEQHACGI